MTDSRWKGRRKSWSDVTPLPTASAHILPGEKRGKKGSEREIEARASAERRGKMDGSTRMEKK